MDVLISTLALTLGAGWASGINLYAAVLVLGLLGASGSLELPAGLAILSDPLVIAAAGFMYLIEFFADKVPGVDTGWDALHTFVRIPAGALLAAGAVGDVGVGAEVAAALVGGGLAAASHAAKAGTRVLINASPEPFSNWAASISEDLGVVGGLVLALTHPLAFLAALALFLALLVWLLPRLWRGIRQLARTIGRFFARGCDGDDPDPAARGRDARPPPPAAGA